MPKAISMLSVCQKYQFHQFNNFKAISKQVAHKESLLKIQQTVNLLVHMPFFKFRWNMEKKDSEKFILSILLVTKEVPIIWTWRNKPKLMVSKSTNLCFNWKNVSEDLIRVRITFPSEDQNLQCVLRIHSLDFVVQWWSVTFRHPLEVHKTL